MYKKYQEKVFNTNSVKIDLLKKSITINNSFLPESSNNDIKNFFMYHISENMGLNQFEVLNGGVQVSFSSFFEASGLLKSKHLNHSCILFKSKENGDYVEEMYMGQILFAGSYVASNDCLISIKKDDYFHTSRTWIIELLELMSLYNASVYAIEFQEFDLTSDIYDTITNPLMLEKSKRKESFSDYSISFYIIENTEENESNFVLVQTEKLFAFVSEVMPKHLGFENTYYYSLNEDNKYPEAYMETITKEWTVFKLNTLYDFYNDIDISKLHGKVD